MYIDLTSFHGTFTTGVACKQETLTLPGNLISVRNICIFRVRNCSDGDFRDFALPPFRLEHDITIWYFFEVYCGNRNIESFFFASRSIFGTRTLAQLLFNHQFDLLLSIVIGGQLHTYINDKRNDFNFHTTNVSFLSSNIPSSPAYGFLIYQLIRYARACSSHECFILRARRLSSKFLKQGYLVERLESSFRNLYGRYGNVIQQYEVSLSRILNNIVTLDQIQWPLYRSDFSPSVWPWYRAWPSLNYKWFQWSICNGCRIPAGNV